MVSITCALNDWLINYAHAVFSLKDSFHFLLVDTDGNYELAPCTSNMDLLSSARRYGLKQKQKRL